MATELDTGVWLLERLCPLERTLWAQYFENSLSVLFCSLKLFKKRLLGQDLLEDLWYCRSSNSEIKIRNYLLKWQRKHIVCVGIWYFLFSSIRENPSPSIWFPASFGSWKEQESHAWTLQYHLLSTTELHLRTLLLIITVFKEDGALYTTMNETSRFLSVKNGLFHKAADACQRTHCD